MIDDEGKLPVEAPDGRYGEGLLYDYSKFLTTLALIALGGVLTLTASADPVDVKPGNVALVIVSIATGGVLAFAVASAIAESRWASREPPRWLKHCLNAAMAFLGVGVGAFLMTWWDSLA